MRMQTGLGRRSLAALLLSCVSAATGLSQPVIGKAPQTVSVNDPSLYSPWLGELRGRSLEIPLRATASSGLPVSYTLESFVLDGEHVELPALIEGDLLRVVRPGTYVVKATQPGGDYWGEASTEFSVRVNGEAVMARLSFDAADLSQVYDGSGKTVGVSVSPDTLEIEVTYDGSPDLPIDVGSYTVRARSADILLPGEIAATLEISIGKAPQTVSVTDPSLYSPWLGELRGRGLEIPLRATASSGLPVSYTLESFVLDGEHVELPALIEGDLLRVVRPGTYVVKATQPGGDYWGEASTEFPVRVNGEAVMARLSFDAADLSQVYDGSAKTVGVLASPDTLEIEVTYDGSPELPVDVGSYTVRARSTDILLPGEIAATLEITIGKAAQTVSVADPSLYSPWLGELRGRGLEIPLRATASSGLPVSYTLESFVLDGEHVELPALIEGDLLRVVRPGTYVVKATQPGGDYWGEASAEFSVRVNGEAVMARLSFEAADLSQVYDGSGKAVGVSASPDTLEIEVTYDGSPDLPVDVGSYTVRARSADILLPGEISATLEIAKAEAEVSIDAAGLVQEAGQLAPVAVATVPEGLAVEVAYGGSPDLPPFEAASIGEVAVTATVVDANYTGGATAVLTIVKAGQAITVPNVDVYNPWPIRIAGQPLEIPLLGSSGSGLEVEFSVDAANASVGGGVLTATQPGSYTVRADQAGDGRWAAASHGGVPGGGRGLGDPGDRAAGRRPGDRRRSPERGDRGSAQCPGGHPGGPGHRRRRLHAGADHPAGRGGPRDDRPAHAGRSGLLQGG